MPATQPSLFIATMRVFRDSWPGPCSGCGLVIESCFKLGCEPTSQILIKNPCLKPQIPWPRWHGVVSVVVVVGVSVGLLLLHYHCTHHYHYRYPDPYLPTPPLPLCPYPARNPTITPYAYRHTCRYPKIPLHLPPLHCQPQSQLGFRATPPTRSNCCSDDILD